MGVNLRKPGLALPYSRFAADQRRRRCGN